VMLRSAFGRALAGGLARARYRPLQTRETRARDVNMINVHGHKRWLSSRKARDDKGDVYDDENERGRACFPDVRTTAMVLTLYLVSSSQGASCPHGSW